MRLTPPGGLVHAIGWALTGTLRSHRFGLANLRAGLAASPHGAAVCCLWHHDLLGVLAVHQRPRRFRIAALASMSGDGAIIADYLQRVGIRPVRGSSRRGGARAARELIEALDQGWTLAIACDGPRGPRRVVKPGTVEIARLTGAPVVPVAARASREFIFRRSWDHFRLPLPRAHLVAVYGAPIFFPPGPVDDAETERRCRQVGAAIEAAEAEAERRLK
jgi:lysophospholipid acyltransferase (LPLAT)-like uncharacterized protein